MRDAEQAVVEVLEGMHIPRMPATISNACWLLRQVLRPHQPEEAPTLVTIANGRGTQQAWRWPYLTRICIEARTFLHLSDDDQRFIVDQHAEGIFWRGDNMEFFHCVVQEQARMRDMGIEAYRREARKRLVTMHRGRA